MEHAWLMLFLLPLLLLLPYILSFHPPGPRAGGPVSGSDWARENPFQRGFARIIPCSLPLRQLARRRVLFLHGLLRPCLPQERKESKEFKNSLPPAVAQLPRGSGRNRREVLLTNFINYFEDKVSKTLQEMSL